jgi:hypothetical protein
MKSKRTSEPALETIHSVCSEESDRVEIADSKKKRDEPSGNTFIISNLPSLGEETHEVKVSRFVKTAVRLGSLVALTCITAVVSLLVLQKHKAEDAQRQVSASEH